jgi:predicted deacetylase
MRRFVVCIHDATPVFDRETRLMIRDLASLLGRRFCVGVVPDWHGQWPLTAHPDYCRLIRDEVEELLLHGYFHRRQRGWGPITLLTRNADEMNGLDAEETRRTLERGQRIFIDAFSAPARGFLAPAWQLGHLQAVETDVALEYVLGFFSLQSLQSLQSCDGRKVPLATWSWDCGRWGWLGHVGQGIGLLRHSLVGGVPVVALHPRDLERGFWPRILRLLQELLDAGYRPSTAADLLGAGCGSRQC